MANQLIYEADGLNSTDPIQFQHPITLEWVDGSFVSASHYKLVLTGIPAGDYLVHKARVKNNTRVFTLNLKVTVLNISSTTPTQTPVPSNFTPRVATGNTLTGKIPFANPQQWYTLNNQQDRADNQGGDQFSDGDTDTKSFFGYGTIYQGQDFESRYTPVELKEIIVKQIKIYGKSDTDAKVYGVVDDKGTKQLLATYNKSGNIQTIDLGQGVAIKTFIITANSYNGVAEVEFYGTYRLSSSAYQYPLVRSPFKRQLGINGFPWNFVASDSANPDSAKMNVLKTFGGFRMYADWYRVENQEGQFSFDYTDGSWNFDKFAKAAKDQDMPMLMCFQKVPQWLQGKNNRPSDQYDDEVIPAPYGLDLLDPKTYTYSARLMYYAAARLGNNPSVDPATLSLTKTGPVYSDWTTPDAPFRSQKIGLNYVDCLEPGNEVDRWWKGAKSYMNGRQVAAYMSANYDGHMGVLNSGNSKYGAKTADSNILVVVPGFADSTTDPVRGMIDWCIENRGYKADGSPNLAWDVMNYHAYPFSGGTQYSGSGAGIAPELSNLSKFAKAHLDLAKEYGYKVWLTETGYDSNESSPLRAIQIGSKGVEAVRADWALRTALLHARLGIDRSFAYETYDQNFGGQFGTSGFLNDSPLSRKAQGDFFFQVKNVLGDYTYVETTSESPVVSKYSKGDSIIYAVHMPTMTDQKAQVTIPGNNATVYTPQIGSDNMLSQTLTGSLVINATETPVFVKVS